MKIFVIHYSKLIDRKKHIIEEFKKHNIVEYEFIEKFNKEDLTSEDIKQFSHQLKPSIVSLIKKQFYVYQLIAQKYPNALIFEDDVILKSGFINTLNHYLTQLPQNYDMLFIGDGCNLHIEKHKITPNNNIYEKCREPTKWGGDGASKCADSYIISQKCAQTLCHYINQLTSKITLPLDWWLNEAIRGNAFNVYWAEPTIVSQGSHTGNFLTSL